MEKQINVIFQNIEQYNKYKLTLKNIAHSFLNNSNKNKPKIKLQDNDKLNINKSNYIDNEFIFKSIENDKYKILFFIKDNIIFIGTFSKSSSTQFQRLLLIHIYIALINIKGNIITTMEKINECEEYDSNNFISLKTIYNKHIDKLLKENNDIIEILMFEYYFLKSIILHFSKVFNEIFKIEDMNLKQTKFKNLYLLDVHNFSIILDMRKIQATEKSQIKNKKFYKFDKLFDEIKYHAKNMYNEYIRENEMKYIEKGLDFLFVKFECTSTFPRLLFIIKFIPILKGIAVIHIYSQKKLSRSENIIQTEQGLNFKEVDILFGSFIKGNPNFEFKYGAPKKLEHVQKFIEEFYITGRNGFGIFRSTNPEKKYKYINYDIVNIINNFEIKYNVDIEQNFENINNKIKEDYEKEKKEKSYVLNETDSSYSQNDDEKDKKMLNNLFLLSKESFYKSFFFVKNKTNINNNYNKNIISENGKYKNENIIINKKIDINKINDLEQNININDINSDRKLLENQSKTLSFNSKETIKDDIKSISKKTKYDSLSKISIVKVKEIFEIKPINQRETNTQENKEDLKEKRSINSSPNEKELKLNELLDKLSSNKEIEFHKIEKNIIQEKVKENELTQNINNISKINKNSITKNKRSKILLENGKGLDSISSINPLINQ